jgi:hypothetical protein
MQAATPSITGPGYSYVMEISMRSRPGALGRRF